MNSIEAYPGAQSLATLREAPGMEPSDIMIVNHRV
jgi:hypothetical protein